MAERASKRQRICIVTQTMRTAEVLREQIAALFGSHFDLDLFALECSEAVPLRGDIILVPGQEWSGKVAPLADPTTPIIPVRRTLQRSGWEKVMGLPSRTRAMLVNNNREAAIETIALLYELGARHIDLIPVYPGCQVPDLDIALTPNEMECVPRSVNRVVNIGDRVIDASTILDIASRFKIPETELSSALSEHLRNTVPRSPGLAAILNGLADTRNELELILDMVREGIVAFDEDGKIKLFNKEAETLLRREAWQVVGRDLRTILPVAPLEKGERLTEGVCNIDGRSFIVNRAWNSQPGKKAIGIVTLRETQDIQNLDAMVRRELKKTGHVAKYTFADIIGCSPVILRTVSMARSIALRDSAVLIHGKSGTGKELFAHAIHSASRRAPYPFVAVNCAALPDSLLESELFGYEEGAFTGARKGGKPGLFEQAHKGTIFLDEIGDISPQLQSRLLRVLQEKEVMRVGGMRLVPVDVRIISATNKDLRSLVEKGLFREDLYYRINVLPLSVPSLTQRLDDLPLLISHFMRKKGDERVVPPRVLQILREYTWPGNVRELENCIEYMLSISSGELSESSLPDYIRSTVAHTAGSPEPLPDVDLLELSPDDLRVLRIVHRVIQAGRCVGRRSIVAASREEGCDLTESRVRSIVRNLATQGYLRVRQGRAGLSVTHKGMLVIRTLIEPN